MSLLSLSGVLVSRFRPSILLLALAVSALSACDKVNLLAPTGSTMTLSVNRTSVPIGGTAEVVAVVLEIAGTAPQNGTVVTFSSTFGTMTPQEAPTSGGIARATFTATGSGEAVISAFSGAAKATEVKIKAGNFAAAAVSVRTEPATIPQSGGTVTVVATVIDGSGGPLPNTLINFAVDNGNLSASAATSDDKGEARVTLTTNRTTKVNANAGSVKATEFTLTAIPNPTISIACPTTPAPSVGVSVTCTVTPTIPTGGSAIQTIAIEWGDGSAIQNLGTVTGATTASHVFTAPGTYVVTATAIDQNGQQGKATASLVVVRVLPTVTITASAATGIVGVAISFTITPNPNPPQPITNVSVDFGDGTSRNLGAATGPQSVTKAYGAEGHYTVTATVTDASNQRGSASTSVVIGKGASPTITFQQDDFLTPANPAIPESFTISAATTISGASIRSIVVTRSDGTEIYNGTGGKFAALVTVNEVLTATATDTLGNVGRTQLIVK